VTRYLKFAISAAVLTACTQDPASPDGSGEVSFAKGANPGLPSSAVVIFGRTGVGSPFDPAVGHDASPHSYDKILPHTVNIAAGGSVTFNLAPFHAVAIYDDGTQPGDVTISPATLDDLPAPFIPDFIINDPTNRIALGPPLNPGAATTWTSPPGTFDEPGTYLVICAVLPHFAGSKMYAFVKVQ
jgi:plastocyanin